MKDLLEKLDLSDENEILNKDKPDKNNNIINNEDVNINQNNEISIIEKDYDFYNSDNNNSIDNSNDEIEMNNLNENINNDDEDNKEKLECGNDLNNLNINNISVLERLLLKEDVNENLKEIITNIKSSKKRFNVSGESDDEKDLKKLDVKTKKIKIRYPKK